MLEPTAKAGWEEKTLGEVCDNVSAEEAYKKDMDPNGDHIPYYGATGVLDHVASLTTKNLLLIR